MRIKKSSDSGMAEGDLTPMIDMTFQLIAFFMVLINLSETEVNQTIVLPQSTLAKPPQSAPEYPVVLQIDKAGNVLWEDEAVNVAALTPYLNRSKEDIAAAGHTTQQATVIIRADRMAKTGDVQRVIQKCKDSDFEKFALRAEEKILDRGHENKEFIDTRELDKKK